MYESDGIRQWKEENPYCREIDTNLWITDLIDAIREGMEDVYLRKSLTDVSLVFTEAEHLWEKEAKGNLAFFLALMDEVDIYQGTDVSADLLLHIAGQSDELQILQLFDENQGIWVLGQSVRDGAYSADVLRDKLSHVDCMLDRFFYDYREA